MTQWIHSQRYAAAILSLLLYSNDITFRCAHPPANAPVPHTPALATTAWRSRTHRCAVRRMRMPDRCGIAARLQRRRWCTRCTEDPLVPRVARGCVRSRFSCSSFCPVLSLANGLVRATRNSRRWQRRPRAKRSVRVTVNTAVKVTYQIQRTHRERAW